MTEMYYLIRVVGLEINRVFKNSGFKRNKVNNNTYKYYFKTEKGAEKFIGRLNSFCREEYGETFRGCVKTITR